MLIMHSYINPYSNPANRPVDIGLGGYLCSTKNSSCLFLCANIITNITKQTTACVWGPPRQAKEELTRYDQNKDGVLDAGEVKAMMEGACQSNPPSKIAF